MFSNNTLLTEAAYIAEELGQANEFSALDRKCLVVKQALQDGDFTLDEALHLYEVSKADFEAFLARPVIAELQPGSALKRLEKQQVISGIDLAARKYEQRIRITSKRATAQSWLSGYAVTGAAIASAAIIPGAASASILALETSMVNHIGRIYRGSDFSKEDAVAVKDGTELTKKIGWGTAAALEGLTFLPIIGWAIKGAIAGSLIKSLGEVIIKYFEDIEES